MAADPRGSMEAPGSVHKKHECPPDRVAMMARMEEISSSYERRLLNQKQVIDNLSDARQKLLRQLAAVERLCASWEVKSAGALSRNEAGAILRRTLEETP
jgi:hypothetical protein